MQFEDHSHQVPWVSYRGFTSSSKSPPWALRKRLGQLSGNELVLVPFSNFVRPGNKDLSEKMYAVFRHEDSGAYLQYEGSAGSKNTVETLKIGVPQVYSDRAEEIVRQCKGHVAPLLEGVVGVPRES